MSEATAPLTRADLAGRKTTNAMHIDFSRGRSAWTYGIEGIPRLTVFDLSDKREGSTRTWSVDGKAVRDLDAALAVLNGTMTLEEAMPQPEPKKKVPIGQQIEEVEYEIKQREQVYPRLVQAGKQRQSVVDFHMERMQAALESLKWLRDNREKIKELLVHEKQKPATAGEAVAGSDLKSDGQVRAAPCSP